MAWARPRAVGVAFIYAITYNYIKVSAWGSRAHGVDVDRLGPGPLRRSHAPRARAWEDDRFRGWSDVCLNFRDGGEELHDATVHPRLGTWDYWVRVDWFLLASGGLSSHLNML